MNTHNLILNTDSYKPSHWLQYPQGATNQFSYIESRGGEHPETVVFGLQIFFKAKNLTNTPKRCHACRAEYRSRYNDTSPRPLRDTFEAVCYRCGKPAYVPFQPRHNRPVFCSPCYDIVRSQKHDYSTPTLTGELFTDSENVSHQE